MNHEAFRGSRTRPAVWTNRSGPGAIRRHRDPHDGITMSIDIVSLAEGGRRADMWVSKTWHYIWLPFVTNRVGVACNHKKAVARLLEKPNTAQLVAWNRDTSVRSRRRPVSRAASR